MNIGDKITFRKNVRSLNYKSDINSDIPSEMIIHGRTTQSEGENTGIIEGFYDKFIICSYISIDGKKVQLGFDEEDIIIQMNEEPNYEVY